MNSIYICSHGEGDEEREENLAVAEGDIGGLVEHAVIDTRVQKRRANARCHRRKDPRDHDGNHSLHVWEGVRFFIPLNTVSIARHHGHADDATNARMGRRDRHLEVRCQHEPNTNAQNHASHAPHEKSRVVLEAFRIGDALADGFRDR